MAGGNGSGGVQRSGRGRRGRRVLRAVPAPPAPPARASRPRCSTPPATSAARGTGTATRAPAATSRRPTTPTASTRSSRTSGPGRRSTPPSRRSCATCGTWPTATTCAATSSSRPASSRPSGTSRTGRWQLRTDRGEQVSCRFYIMATGCLSLPKAPDIEGADRFAGEVYFTSRWPHEGVDFTGKRVAVIGTGSSGIQSIPLIAARPPSSPSSSGPPNFSDPRPQRPAVGRARWPPLAADRAALPGGRQVVAAAASRSSRPTSAASTATRGGAPGALRGGVGSRRAVRDPRRLRRPGGQPGVQRDRRRDDPGEDPRRRGRPGDRRGALPQGPPLRHQAALPRHRLLRDLQPAARPARRPAQAPDHDHHRDGDRHRRRVDASSTPSSTPPASTP